MDWSPYQHLVRPTPPEIADERTMLRVWLDFQRMTLFRKLQGLDGAQLIRRPIPPSTMSLLGLLRHSTDGELALFRAVVLAEDVAYLYGDDTPLGGDFDGIGAADVARDIELWLHASAESRRIEASVDSLDTTGRELWSGQGPVTLRWVMVHMIEEYARHNGHADLLREVIDGTTGY